LTDEAKGSKPVYRQVSAWKSKIPTIFTVAFHAPIVIYHVMILDKIREFVVTLLDTPNIFTDTLEISTGFGPY
jgi:hypothetical protein